MTDFDPYLILGVAMTYGAAAQDYPQLQPEHFSDKWSREVWRAIQESCLSGQLPNPITVAHRAGDAVSSKDLLRLCADATSLVCLPDFVDTVIDAGSLRLIREAADAGDVKKVDELSRAINRARNNRDSRNVHERVSLMFDEMRRAANGESISLGATTGLKDLDARIGGLVPGDLVILAGRPGMGKSTVMTSVALQTAKAGHPVCIVSLEMPAEQLYQRMCCDVAWSYAAPIPYSHFRAGSLSHDDLDRLDEAYSFIRGLPLTVVDASLSIAEIRATAMDTLQGAMRRTGKHGVLFIDYLGLIRATERYKGQRVNEISEMTLAAKAMAKEGITVVLLSQLNRGLEQREDKRPFLADLRDSGSIEQDADSVIFAYREAYYLQKQRDAEQDAGKQADLSAQLLSIENDLELIVAKNRHGPVGTVRVFCDIQSSAVRDAARHYEAPQ